MPEKLTLTAECIDSPRLRLRKARDSDADGIIETQTDERIRRYLGGPRPRSEVAALIESIGIDALTANPGTYIVADIQTDEMLGMVVLDRRHPDVPGHLEAGGNELELSYVFRHHAWSKGYATEAASALLRTAAAELPDQQVLLVTQSANHASLRLSDRLGFRVVATFTQFEAEQSLAVAQLSSFQ
jgi:RimJ/RimL family protein N-acetyltransferase